MKTLWVTDIKADTGTIDEFFQVAGVEKKATGAGKPYLNLKLADKTGEVAAKLWDIPADLPDLKVGQFVKARVEAGTYRDALQLKVLKIRPLTPDEVALEDYLPASKRDRPDMFTDLLNVAYSISEQHLTLRCAVTEMLNDIQPQLMDCPAAKSNHQAYLGGLLEHILQLCRLVDGVCAVYPELNRDVLIAGAILHDIGKVFELCYQDHIGYTRSGTLTGHIVQGSILWFKYSGGLDPATRDHVEHIIVSHHGQKTWGSPVEPMTREAAVFHYLDMIDSRYEMMTGVLDKGVDADGLTPWNFKLGSAVWNGQ